MLEFDWDVFYSSLPKLIAASQTTLLLLIASSVLGLIIAVILAICSRSRLKPIVWATEAHLFFYRGTPLLVQIYLFYFGTAQFKDYVEAVGLWRFFSEAWFCAMFAFTLNTSAYLAEIIRGGIKNLPPGELEAARAYGFSSYKIYQRILLPRVFQEIVPAWGNEVILMMKATSLASTITILDMMGMARKLASDTFAPIEVFLAAGALYLVLTGFLTALFALTERYVQRKPLLG